MQRRGGSGQPVKGQSANRPKARKAPTAQVSTADLQEQLDRRTRERDEALEQQAATAEVLQVISRSTFDLPAVLNTLIEIRMPLCGADIGTIRFEEGDRYCLAATSRLPAGMTAFRRLLRQAGQDPVIGQTISKAPRPYPGRSRRLIFCGPQAQKLMGLRAALGVPLVAGWHVFGVVNLFRTTPTRSQKSRSSWSRISPIRPSSPSRIRGCSTNCASAPTISPRRWSSRRRPRRC